MSSSRWGETKLLYRAGWGKLKGDTSQFWINERRATISASPFAMKMRRVTSMRISNTRKREACVLGARLALGSPHYNFRPALSPATLSKFSTLRSLLLCCHLRNHCAAAATYHPQPRSRSTLPPRPRPQGVPPPSSSSSSWSLSHYHYRPRLRLHQSMPPPSTLTPLPPSSSTPISLSIKP
jgi:hypothetical protein